MNGYYSLAILDGKSLNPFFDRDKHEERMRSLSDPSQATHTKTLPDNPDKPAEAGGHIPEKPWWAN